MPVFKASLGLFDGDQMHDAGTWIQVDETRAVLQLGRDEIPAGETLTEVEGWISPGFINCHCHVELSHLKDLIPERTGLVGFIKEVFRHRQQPAEAVEAAARAALSDMRASGIQAVGDICNTTQAMASKQESPLWFVNFIEISGFVPATAADRHAGGMAVLEAYEAVFPGQNQLVPHSPYSVSPPLFELIAKTHRPHLPTTMHNQESAAENAFFEKGSGDFRGLYDFLGIDTGFFRPSAQSSLDSIAAYLPQNGRQLLVHNTFFDQKTSAFQAGREIFLCLCPNANLYIENTLPDIAALMQTGFPLVLGTDSLASNHRLSIGAEIRTLLDRFPQLSMETVLRWATSNGAKALGMENELGNFRPGTRPGVVVLQKDDEAQRLV